ncbi:T9SS type A sorting domain-containing protein [Chryseobacterium luquanense]|uniref:T9SS type A sorting domain-containing protein n=1 Tax=Chryseobacterium luquanense TaxID=2983766 RepID=A0ABT3XZT5_9FLAO|nr:T9SS type A sorting domain-containing protein [Chryseobacterium luquanense]MCX8531366.1 T9SS type A sorting domain-containing protein [Chryseobacterium luquanense]
MKKLNFLFLLLMSVFACQLYWGQTYTVPVCSGTVATNGYGTLNSNATANSKSRGAFIIASSQLVGIADGTITSTYLKRLASSGSMNNGATFKIYLKNTTATDFGSAALDWATAITGATLVYDSNPQTAIGSTAGFKEFAHSTNFVYTAGSNLAVFTEYVQTTAQATTIDWEYEYTGPCINTSNSNTTKYVTTTGTFGATLTSSDYRRPHIAFNATVPPPTTVPGCTTVSAPAAAATGVSVTPTITWAPNPITNSYKINIGTTPGGTDVMNGVDVGNVTTYTIPAATPLNFSTQYYYTVIPVNAIGSAVGCSERSFTTLAIPCPSIGTPAAAATGVSHMPTITWTAISGVSGYRIRVGTSAGAGNILSNVDLGNVTSYTFATALNPSTQYFYLITAYQGASVSTGCTERSFTTGVTPPPANDNCSGAIALTVNPDLLCGVKTPGNTLGATLSMAATPCSGNPDDDVWFSFIATSTVHNISLTNVVATGTSTSIDMYFNVLSGACGAMTSVLCSDPDSSNVTGLTIGQKYYVRVYNYAGAGANNSFNICVGTPPPPPVNDNCSGAVTLTVNPDYLCGATTTGTTVSATQSTETAPTCGATGVNDDVWYKFTATNALHRISLTNVSASTDMAMAIYSGACGSLVQVMCSDPDTMDVTGLTPGNSYFVRVWTYTATITTTATFSICVGTPPPPPANDNCSGAVTLTVNPDYLCGVSTAGNTQSATASTETAPTCGATGTNDDVWYKFTATNVAHRITLSNVSGSTDMAMAAYSGACGSLVQVACSDPNTMDLTGLTVGQEYKIRVWTFTATATTVATFSICVGTLPAPPVNDDCSAAITLTVNPDLSCGVTTAGNTQSATASTETAPTCGATGTNDDVWFKFTATSAAHTVVLSNVSGSTDMAMAAYSGACGSLVQVMCSDPNTMNLTGLTVGQEYKIRVWTFTATATTVASFNICVGTPPAPPANDACSGAIALVPGANFAQNVITTTNVGATTDGSTTCQTSRTNNVWYSVVVPASGSITVETASASGSGFIDSILSAHSGTCGALVNVDCNDDVSAGTNNFSKISLTGQTPGAVLYFSVWRYSSGVGVDGTFQISAYDASLSTTETVKVKSNIKAYPNPFVDVLNISDVSNVKSIFVMDISGKLVKTFDKPESTLQLRELNSGMYLVVLNMKDGSKQTIKVIKK